MFTWLWFIRLCWRRIARSRVRLWLWRIATLNRRCWCGVRRQLTVELQLLIDQVLTFLAIVANQNAVLTNGNLGTTRYFLHYILHESGTFSRSHVLALWIRLRNRGPNNVELLLRLFDVVAVRIIASNALIELGSFVRLFFELVSCRQSKQHLIHVREVRILVDDLFVSRLRAFQTAFSVPETGLVVEVTHLLTVQPQVFLDFSEVILNRGSETRVWISLQ